jgi:hypothetical protein
MNISFDESSTCQVFTISLDVLCQQNEHILQYMVSSFLFRRLVEASLDCIIMLSGRRFALFVSTFVIPFRTGLLPCVLPDDPLPFKVVLAV